MSLSGWGKIRVYAKVHFDATAFEPASSSGVEVWGFGHFGQT
ncbi:hypothetical protein CES85_3381 (plasmid) [Ochrobactrum quorumnocens]|uniref:Uncharacterized protein n=1 Tax=Ochrobactrum quorumnocens TaxID=271865 RepID=A0A248UN61_9HYPH|nr:hypothetical protein CES85_3381 [[Ochrobactrum] quorumnocens]